MLQQLRALVAMNESLKKQEQQFKAHCKVLLLLGRGDVIHSSSSHAGREGKIRGGHCSVERSGGQRRVGVLRPTYYHDGAPPPPPLQEHMAAVRSHYEADKEKLQKIKSLLVGVFLYTYMLPVE